MIKVLNKYILFAVLIIPLVLFTIVVSSCKNIDSDDSKYDIVIDQYREAITKFNNEQKNKTSWGVGVTDTTGHVYGFEYVVSNGGGIPSKYILKDLDDDGTNELLISTENYICNIFDIVDGKPEMVYLGWERSFLTIRDNNVLMHKGSGGFDIGVMSAVKYKHGVEDLVGNKNLKLVEQMEWSGLDYRSQKQVEIKYLNKDSEIIDQKLIPTTNLSSEIDNFDKNYPLQEVIEWNQFL